MPPLLEPVSDDLEVERGDAVTISFMLLKANPQIVASDTVWSKDNVPLDYTDDKYSISMDTLSLTVNNVQLSDQGMYTIYITNKVNSTSSSATVEVFGGKLC